MAIESTACFRRLASAGLLVLSGLLSLCGAASAQVKDLVTTASIIPLPSSSSYCSIYQILNNPAGDTLFLDACGAGKFGAIYQLSPGSQTLQTVVAGIDTGGTYWNEGMAMDAVGTIYVTDRYGTAHMFRTPYDPAKLGYDFSASADVWETTLDSGFENKGTINVAFLDSAKRDGSGTLFVSTELGNSIMAIPVNADGTVPTFPSGPNAGQAQFQYIIRGLTDKVQPMVVDRNGNLYFIENPYDPPASRVTGVFFIPASAYTSCMAASAAGGGTPTVGCIAGSKSEGSLSRIDPGNTEKFNGLALDAAGNVYVTDESDGYGGTRNGTLMIPNESGSPVGVTAQSFNFEDAEYLTPSASDANPTVDPRGFIWTPTGTSGNYSPNGSGPIPNTGNFILWQLGTANLGPTPVGTPSAPGAIFYSFSGTVVPASFGGSEPGGANFSASSTNPYPAPTGTTPAIPCTAGPSAAGTPTTYIAFSYCEYWPTLTPQGMNSVGQISGQLSMLDANNKVISGSTTYLSGVGEGPAAALLVPAQQTPLATGLMSPQQVAGDSLGNSYVADSGLKQVLMFPAGSTSASAGTPIGTGLNSPTGVAVDGAGNVYIADSGTGEVLEVAAVNGVLNPAATPVVLQSGLGKKLQLAVDNAQNVYVADPDNARVVKIFNPEMSMVIEGTTTVGTFTKPTAVATDDVGNVYVADGANLDEVNFWGGQTTLVPGALAAPVTGLAVDPSGSVYIAQTGGIIRIPYQASSTGSPLTYSDAVQIDNSNGAGITAPSGIGMDALGNLYATAASYSVSSVGSSGAISTPVTTPNLLLLSGAFANFGIVSQFTETDPIDVDLYNIGNEPLVLTGTSNPTFTGTNPDDYSVEVDGSSPCDTSGATPIASGTDCQLGVGATTQGIGLSQATMTVTTSAVNAPSTTATLTSYSSDLLCRTMTTITLTPATGLVYPGATTVTSTTVPDPANPCAAGGVPQGGNIVLTLAPQARGAAQSTQSAKLPASGQYTFNLTGLNGGSYILYVGYKGDETYGGSSSSRTFTIPVAQAIPTITLGNPQGVAPVNGTYYVLQGATTTLQASVTSTVGSPTGGVQFLNGTAPADPTQNPVDLSAGIATFNTSNLAAGTYNLTAVYSSDANFSSVTSSVVTIVVIPPSALITANPPSVTTAAGTAVVSTLTITALEGYSPQKGAQLYCDNSTLPYYSECTFDVPTIDLYDHPGVPQTSHVTISSNIPVNFPPTSSQLRTGSSPILFAGMFGLGLLGLAVRRRKKFNRSTLQVICLTLLFAGAAIGFAGCTNSSYTKTPPVKAVLTPSGTYNVRIYTVDLTNNQTSSLPFTLSLTIK